MAAWLPKAIDASSPGIPSNVRLKLLAPTQTGPSPKRAGNPSGAATPDTQLGAITFAIPIEPIALRSRPQLHAGLKTGLADGGPLTGWRLARSRLTPMAAG